MARVWLVRHGEAAAVWGGGGDPDPGLSPLGAKQADAASITLTDLKPKRILSSPLRRCRETASPLSRQTGLAVEIEPHVAEIPTPADLAPDQRQPWLRAALASEWAAIPGGDYLAWRDRVVAAVVAAEGAAIFSHFVAINAAVSVALGSSQATVFRPGNGSITIFEIEDGRLRLVSLGAEAQSAVL